MEAGSTSPPANLHPSNQAGYGLELLDEPPASVNSVLIISYYFPPSGGPGVQRVLKFVKYLPEFGWRPVVLTVEDGDFFLQLVKSLPAGELQMKQVWPGGYHDPQSDLFEQ